MQKEISELFFKGCELLKQENYQESEEYFQKIIALEPEHLGALNKLGVAAAGKEDLNKAADYFEEVLNIDPTEVTALTNRGSIYYKVNDLIKAEEYYLKALSFNKKYGAAHNNLAALYKTKGDFPKMVKSLKMAKRAGYFASEKFNIARFLILNPFILLAALVVVLLAVFFARGGR